jgi:hypothetical protein
MILAEFASFLQNNNEIIIQKKSCINLLGLWIKAILEKAPKSNVDKIIHQEIMLLKNKNEDYFLIAKSESGRTLTNALYNFALSYEQQVLKKWLQDKTPKDFTTEL